MKSKKSVKERVVGRGPGRPATGKRRAKIAISLDPRVLADMKAVVQESGQSLSAVIAEACAHQSRMRRLEAALSELDEVYGPTSKESKARARAEMDRLFGPRPDAG